jgi:hypothetical protein
MSQHCAGRPDEAIEVLTRAIAECPALLSGLAFVLAQHGRSEEARRIVEETQERTAIQGVISPYDCAEAFISGRPQAAARLPTARRRYAYLLPVTVVFCVTELLLPFKSCVVAVTVAVSVSTVPGFAITLTATLMVARALAGRFPRFTLTVPLLPMAGAVTVPWLDEALAKTLPAGVAFETATPVAVIALAFLTSMEYVTVPPDGVRFGADSIRPTSAGPLDVTV